MRKLKNDELFRKTEEEFKQADKKKITIILDNIRSLNNIGSVFRTADAFLLEQIFLCGITGTPPHNDIRKTAIGAEKTVNWQYFDKTEDAVKLLLEKNYTIYSVEQADKSIKLQDIKISKTEKYALVFGNEVKGVGAEIVNISSGCIEIPQEGTKHSLNISVCAGMVLWEFYKQMMSSV